MNAPAQFVCKDCLAVMPERLKHRPALHFQGCKSVPLRPVQPRRAHFTIAWRVHRPSTVKVTIEIDPRGNAQLVLRPSRSRRVVRVDLADLAQGLVEKDAKLAVKARTRNRRSKR